MPGQKTEVVWEPGGRQESGIWVNHRKSEHRDRREKIKQKTLCLSRRGYGRVVQSEGKNKKLPKRNDNPISGDSRRTESLEPGKWGYMVNVRK